MKGTPMTDTANLTNGMSSHYEIETLSISDMTDRQIAEETLFWLRETGKALAEIQAQGIGGMMKMMMGGKK